MALALVVLIGLAPTIVAVARRSRYLPTVVALNILLGWTLIGWVAAYGFAVVRRGDAIKAKGFLQGAGLMFALLVGYEVLNWLWFHVPAP
jgi:hypothetical protein